MTRMIPGSEPSALNKAGASACRVEVLFMYIYADMTASLDIVFRVNFC